jgi:hypothetical protein
MAERKKMNFLKKEQFGVKREDKRAVRTGTAAKRVTA